MKTNEVAAKTKWSVDQAHSEISFRVRHLMIAHVNGLSRHLMQVFILTGVTFRLLKLTFG